MKDSNVEGMFKGSSVRVSLSKDLINNLVNPWNLGSVDHVRGVPNKNRCVLRTTNRQKRWAGGPPATTTEIHFNIYVVAIKP